MEKIFIQTHGCSTNMSESEIMAGLLKKAGFNLVNSIEECDIAIINICTVKGEIKATRNIRLLNEHNKKLIVAGCITNEIIKEIRKVNEDASILNTHNITRIVEVVEEVINGNIIEAVSIEKEIRNNLPKVRRNPIVGIISILGGCNNECAYCSVKLVKGKLESYSKEYILKEVIDAVSNGCKELWITSQDNASFGTEEIWRSSLPELLEEIIAVEGDFKIRIGMMNPANLRPIIDDMIKIYQSDKVFKFLHVPLQSGNDEILIKMRRKYSVEDYTELVNRFREKIPNLTLAMDLIVGFPGETDEQFNDSLNAVKNLRPDVLNISKFVKRPRTEAFYMKDQVKDIKIKSRSKLITDIFHNVARMNNEKWYNWAGEVLIDEKGKDDSWIGRNYSYKQVILKGNYQLGDKLKVKITNVTPFDLRASLIIPLK